MTEDEKRSELRDMVNYMRVRAAQVGSMHAWWELIFDVEAFLDGGRTIMDGSLDVWRFDHRL